MGSLASEELFIALLRSLFFFPCSSSRRGRKGVQVNTAGEKHCPALLSPDRLFLKRLGRPRAVYCCCCCCFAPLAGSPICRCRRTFVVAGACSCGRRAKHSGLLSRCCSSGLCRQCLRARCTRLEKGAVCQCRELADDLGGVG